MAVRIFPDLLKEGNGVYRPIGGFDPLGDDLLGREAPIVGECNPAGCPVIRERLKERDEVLVNRRAIKGLEDARNLYWVLALALGREREVAYIVAPKRGRPDRVIAFGKNAPFDAGNKNNGRWYRKDHGARLCGETDESEQDENSYACKRAHARSINHAR